MHQEDALAAATSEHLRIRHPLNQPMRPTLTTDATAMAPASLTPQAVRSTSSNAELPDRPSLIIMRGSSRMWLPAKLSRRTREALRAAPRAR